MRSSTISAALILATLDFASGSPAQLKARQDGGVVTLFGAGPDPDFYTLNPSFSGANFTIGTSHTTPEDLQFPSFRGILAAEI